MTAINFPEHYVEGSINLNLKLPKSVIILWYIFLSFIILVIFSGFVSSYTLDQQQQVCSTLNFSFVECYELWSFVEDYENFTLECQPEYINVTKYVNQTIEIEGNCSEKLDWQKEIWDHEYRMSQLEKDCPACEGISQTECDLQISQALSDSSPPGTDNDSSEPWFFHPFALVLGGIIAFFVFKLGYKKFRNSPQGFDLSQRYPPVPFGPNHHAPQVARHQPPALNDVSPAGDRPVDTPENDKKDSQDSEGF